MANAYSTFARGGIRMQPTALKRVEDSRGRQIPLKIEEPVRVFNPEPIASLVSILVDVVEKGTGKNAQLPGRTVAGKTGTTDSVRDIWFTGFTPDMAACVWMGNTRYVPLHGVFSSNAAKVWHDFAQAYYTIRPVTPTTFTQSSSMLTQNTQSPAGRRHPRPTRKAALPEVITHTPTNDNVVEVINPQTPDNTDNTPSQPPQETPEPEKRSKLATKVANLFKRSHASHRTNSNKTEVDTLTLPPPSQSPHLPLPPPPEH
jgi:membrane peptidoglycan carboxypeptidase